MLALQSSRKSADTDSSFADSCTPNVLPCKVHHDGPVELSQRYWKPVTDEKDDNRTAYFRGRKLRGRRVQLPDGYQGVVAVPTDRVLPVANKGIGDQDTDAVAEEPVKTLEAQSTFDEFIVWDHETLAAADDTFVKGVEEWIKFAEVMHDTPEKPTENDQNDRRISLLGQIDGKQGILIAERAAFATESVEVLQAFHASLARVRNLGNNDIYKWYMASTSPVESGDGPPDLKLNLIWPCTAQHIKKYSAQLVRMVTETPQIYKDYIRPYMQQKREQGRLNWVFNILEGRTEQEDVILRDTEHGPEDGFLVLPDLNWDRKTIGSLHLLALVERRDIWSLRDLKKKHIPWLKYLRQRLLEATVKIYPDLEQDQLKLYVHYQPTYYHFHVHIVNVMLEAGATQSVGKAFGLENIIGQLEALAGDDEAGMADTSISYYLGEENELWATVYEPLKKGNTPAVPRAFVAFALLSPHSTVARSTRPVLYNYFVKPRKSADMASHPDVPHTQKAFVPLENNPEVMSHLVHQLGLPPAFGFSDVFSIDDPDLLAFVPRPANALLLVFPVSEAYEASRVAEDAPLTEYDGSGPDEPVMWFKQTIRNACGLIGLLHAVSNGEVRQNVIPGSDLDNLLREAEALRPIERADLLYESKALESAHADAAKLGDTTAPDAEDNVDLHFVAFVKGSDGKLWELDGRRKGPLVRAELTADEDVLSDKALDLGPRPFLKKEAEGGKGDLRFSLVSLGPVFD
ncbi:scavenger mRNA-decapping enzyme DcpS [Talaromyces islandicus]|uniref:ubiquitinyl hydrolase 1 n=1 Tax=Talaromyces islandicus TaxID=28573 RepID=A0A0U1M6C7_TALIS|nr:scavenger mRNA-decapping enzyme DcpS [Talaromyces islandicus]